MLGDYIFGDHRSSSPESQSDYRAIHNAAGMDSPRVLLRKTQGMTLILSYPRRRVSIFATKHRKRWIPAFAGMTIFLLIAPFLAWASPATPAFDYSSFERIPVLHEGRVKPLFSVARIYLRQISGKSALPDVSATGWLAELVFAPELGYKRRVFAVRDPETLAELGLEPRNPARYDFREISGALGKQSDNIKALIATPREEYTPEQRRLADILDAVTTYADLSHSFSLMLPLFDMTGNTQAIALMPDPKAYAHAHLSFLDIHKFQEKLVHLVQPMLAKGETGKKLTDDEQALLTMLYQMQVLEQEGAKSALLRVIPPQWADRGEEWFSPWGMVEAGQGSPRTTPLMALWQGMMHGYRNNNVAEWNLLSTRLRAASLEMAGARVNPGKLELEILYYRWDVFGKSLALYVLGLAALLAGQVGRREFFRKAAFSVIAAGATLHGAGIALRILILSRPPVTTLYESILFVSLILALGGLLMAWRRAGGLGLLIAGLGGAALLYISLGYAVEGDTLSMPVAVLNTNFWLATHVLCITIGYGASLVAGVTAHAWLFACAKRVDGKKKSDHQLLFKHLQGMALVALFFTALGTILGGIWADQSWGRFWGWDPKENGAMLIVLWLIWVLHARVSGHFGETGFAAGMALTNIIVAVAWFGVNLLSVGLHSYGFTNHVALSLGAFCVAELIAVFTLYFMARSARHA